MYVLVSERGFSWRHSKGKHLIDFIDDSSLHCLLPLSFSLSLSSTRLLFQSYVVRSSPSLSCSQSRDLSISTTFRFRLERRTRFARDEAG